ncbi:glycosyltransferase family 4 protein [Treponema primitia]|uniref:glycosyltransferase family 4 protein n=1 Tax=Treponema primitia TaxID=88058 RepID=UPI00191C55B8|nr:glycosyltransferase family 4 protein [Treponema primitia]
MKTIILKALKFAHKNMNCIVIFQNDEDRKVFINNNIIEKNQSYKLKGSGVDLDVFKYKSESADKKIRVLFTARMLRDKGVIELVDAALILKDSYQDKVEFLLCGDIDDNPRSLTRSELEALSDGTYIKWLGHRTDIQEILEESHIFAFPSYYGEGIPKSLIEACAAGRPIITTNSIGCKDTVIDGYNGYLVPIKNSKILAEKIKLLIDDKSLRKTMGENSRKLAEINFSLKSVIETHLEIYNKLLT